jgi:hypothetical protein
MMMKQVMSIGWVLVALGSALALAQDNYKSTLPDGRVVYGDKPAPGATKVEKMKAPSTKGVTAATPKETKALKDMEDARAGRESSGQSLKAAEEALRKAEAAQAAGKEPKEGDRLGTASGAQRFTDAYWERQKALERDVAAARANYERAQQEAGAAGTPGAPKRETVTVTPGGSSTKRPAQKGSLPCCTARPAPPGASITEQGFR